MIRITLIIFIFILGNIPYAFSENQINTTDISMAATGSFEVKLDPQNDEVAPAGRMLINKVYSGGLVGSGIGQMISKRTESGSAVYSAIEEFEGSLDGKIGSFTLVHRGFMSPDKQSLEITVLEDTGTEELEGISGKLEIMQDQGKHSYVLDYQL